jgi:predicted TIM-barrel fold metal-dependent hydrolase
MPTTGRRVISADCHIDLIWLPPDLFTANATAKYKDRMPFVQPSPAGPTWVSNAGAAFGLQCGMGSAGRPYVPGDIQRSDRMAETGLYAPEQRELRRLTDPTLRLLDQDRDGVSAEILYGILGASMRLNDPDAATEMMRIYNEWLADFCDTHPERYAGLANIPNHDVDAAVVEMGRVAKRGAVRGIEVANTHDMKPLFHPDWDPMWAVANEAKLPVHFHTVGAKAPNVEGLAPLQRRQQFAVHITGFQMGMSRILMEIIFGGVLEKYQNLQLVIGESGIGWIPYVLEHMDLEWEDQFKDLTLTMKPSQYWARQCRATYQSDEVGIALLDRLGENNIMWGSDYPHPDGVWPDSQAFIDKEIGHLPAAQQHKIVFENAAKLYGFATD